MNLLPRHFSMVLMIRAITLTAALPLPAMAAPLLSPPEYTAPSFSQIVRSDSSELRDIIALLEKGDKKAAKPKLASFLATHPQDPRGTEIAGMIFMEEKNWDPAVISFKRILAKDPARIDIRPKLGVALLMSGKNEEGIAELKRVISARPTDPFARRYLGWIAEAQEKREEALAHYSAMIKEQTTVLTEFHALTGKLYNQSGQYGKTINLLAPLAGKGESKQAEQSGQMVLVTAYMEQKNRKEAAKILRSLEKITPATNPELRLAQAELFRLERNYPKSRERLQAVIKDSPAFKDPTLFRLANVYAEEGNHDQAVSTLESLAEQAPKEDLPRILSTLTAWQFDHNKNALAIKTLEKYASRSKETRYLLAEAQARDDRFDAAMATVTDLLTAEPQFAAAHYLAGMIHKTENRVPQAEINLQQAVRLAPVFAEAWAELAELYKNDPSKAASTLQKALEASPEEPSLLFRLGLVRQSMNQTDKANEAYRRILKTYPNHIPALNNLSSGLTHNPATLKEARELAARAWELDKKQPASQDTYGWALIKSGETGKGIPLLEAAVKSLDARQHHTHAAGAGDHHHHDDAPALTNLHPGNAYYHLGAAYMKTGKNKEGASYLNRALKSGVDTATANEIKTLLKI